MRKFLYACSAITIICLSLGISSASITSTEMLTSQETVTPDSRNDPTLPSED
ncbi:hypothetical protein M3936_09955 [Sutcliffiella horikoshii]|uniref:hypothetical protein n=1 Tax=Sutcliffiella horikoshii TaxID=79883 RepID=UPI000A83B818|nr:hypothetical protein [Sutcliffiella horikoshii]MCM3617903.1 hypothetical protein [Sutcliffiella horikoshii]